MGCSLSASLASPSADTSLSKYVLGVVAMCPRVSAMTANQIEAAQRLLRTPNPIFDLMRKGDLTDGTESRSVRRMAGSHADAETKKLQLRYNAQSKTPVWRRMFHGLLPKDSVAEEDLPTTDLWTTLNTPVFLIAGKSDGICPPSEVHALAVALRNAWKNDKTAPDGRPPRPLASEASPTEIALLATPRRRALKSTVLLAPASHPLPYSPTTIRELSGVIQHFLLTNIDPRLAIDIPHQLWKTEYQEPREVAKDTVNLDFIHWSPT